MAAITSAVIAAGTGLYAANQQAGAARDSANAAQGASDAAIAEQRRQYDQSRTDQLPWMQAGTNALGMQQRFINGDYGEALKSPDYAARLSQGIQSLDRGAAARGRLYSGGADADRMRFGADLATDGLNSYWNRLAGLSGTGQSSATTLGQQGQALAGSVGNNLWGAANARSSGYQQSANANSQAAFGIAGAANNWYQNNSANNGGGSGFYLGNNPGRG